MQRQAERGNVTMIKTTMMAEMRKVAHLEALEPSSP